MSIPHEIESAIEAMAKQLSEQKRRSVRVDDRCMYRSPDGAKCAVGALIPDEVYDDWFEGLAPRQLRRDDRYRVGGFLLGLAGQVEPDLFFEFLDLCQIYHDAEPDHEPGTCYQTRIEEGDATFDRIVDDLREVWRGLVHHLSDNFTAPLATD